MSRYARNSVLAFPKTMEYAACIERPWPPLWKRVLLAIIGKEL